MPSLDQDSVGLTDRGATSIEYSLMTSLISVVILAAVTMLGLNVLALFNLMPAGL
jgi:Flp pilus assembly pilin Flp